PGTSPEPRTPAPPSGNTQPPTGNVRTESVVDSNQVAQRAGIPVMIPPQTPPTAAPPGSTPVPSCVLTGRQLHNFALNDLGGHPWEYRNHHGRLVLLDFWGSWCVPCLQTIPHLTALQQRYGGYGLEVIGIAYEQNGASQEQAHRIERVRQRLRINYRLLMGGGSQCPVQTQFQIGSLPTLVL